MVYIYIHILIRHQFRRERENISIGRSPSHELLNLGLQIEIYFIDPWLPKSSVHLIYWNRLIHWLVGTNHSTRSFVCCLRSREIFLPIMLGVDCTNICNSCSNVLPLSKTTYQILRYGSLASQFLRVQATVGPWPSYMVLSTSSNK